MVRNRRTATIHSSEEYPIFVMECGELKIMYLPLNPNKGFRIFYYGKKDYPRFINGTEQLMEAYAEHDKGRAPEPKVMICAHIGDALNMAGLGYHTLWTPANHAYFDMKVLGRMIEGRASIKLSDEFKKLSK